MESSAVMCLVSLRHFCHAPQLVSRRHGFLPIFMTIPPSGYSQFCMTDEDLRLRVVEQWALKASAPHPHHVVDSMT